MLRAMINQINNIDPESEISIGLTHISGDYLERAKLGLFNIPKLWRHNIQLGRFINYLLGNILKNLE